ncbi:DUF4747 family protein [Pseudomonas stutzeri]|uniref:DUF4747 family protein n=1 Tax=Stutzerimonas stutzeri TaxID=316 RepID=A0A2N8RZ10_STUST|nr:DUF4747 family protein [Stutzerimonas stutzeri]MCQ4297479.1 DUF4747 family protein [Stutzerimonas stutzeri]PNF79617.1 hypothetical protein CXK92_13280 [Stutzerimonas stutzeri]
MAAIKRNKAKQIKKIRFEVASLNIVLHPHSPERYIDLFRTIHETQLDAKVRGDDALMLGSFYSADEGSTKTEAYAGTIYKFLKLNAAEDWFNTLKMDAASREDVKDIVIPDHLKPHFKRFQYVFFPKKHRLYFISKKTDHNLSPLMVKRFFESISTHANLAEFGELNVTVQPERGVTDELFKIENISVIELEIRKPNPDDHDDVEEDILERLQELNAGKEKRQYFSATPEGLQPDAQLKALAAVASENGSVYAKGRTAGNIVEISTKDRPLKATASYNPDLQSELNALLEKAEELHREILSGKAI